jgi:hypothetical protein
MTDVIEMIDPVTGEIIDQQQIAAQLLAQAKEQGVSLVGPGGLLGNTSPSASPQPGNATSWASGLAPASRVPSSG